MTWLMQNIGTIVVLLVLVIIVAAIVHKLYSDNKKGIHSCGGHCGGGCPGCSSCGGSCSSCSAHKK
ncbi:FeoB-associated Cys-rich membrane protein [Butyricicoccus sp.]|uniref:FeoB-associated Cys-rich membrane protein n=1 Tax=Butyricicoccus sp. TaxID=2049021 RepID=UPI003D7CC486